MNSPAKKRRNLARWAIALVAVAGGMAAWQLTGIHIQAAAGEALGGPLCGGPGVLDCESAVHSRYSELAGIPIALLGLSFYVASFFLAVLDRASLRNSSDPYRPAAIATTTFSIGVGYSIFLAGVSYFEVGSICPFCAMLYAVNGVGLVAASVWAGAAPHRVVMGQLKKPGKFFNGWTGIFAFAFAMVLIAGTWSMGEQIDGEIHGESATTDRAVGEEPPSRYSPAEYRSADAPAKGPADAPVHIVEFSNFPCPYCAELAGVLERLYQEYDDQIRIEYRHFPIASQPQGKQAAIAAYCAGEQQQFWAMHDKLFANAPAHGPQQLRRYAAEIDLDEQAFERCMDSDAAAAHVESDVAAGARLGVEGTPTYFINGQRFQGVLPYEVLQEVVDQAQRP